MSARTSAGTVEIARGVHWLPILGTNVYFVRSGESWVLIDTGFPGSGRIIAESAKRLCGAWLWDLVRRTPRLSGPPTAVTCDWRDAAASVVALADLDPWVLATGHGTPFVGAPTAPALRAFAARCERADGSDQAA
ncbi:MAG: MBL fold metallo-hydrolase [Actinobacteria bacterium]|nr:MBL fold metallo-hydrolase [Actinomycetota bacterium]